MAIVYKAKDVVLNRNVAVKVLRDEFKQIMSLYEDLKQRLNQLQGLHIQI